MINFLQGNDHNSILLKKYNQLENGIAFIVFIGLVIFPATDFLIREIIRPIIPTLSKIPASQTIVSHLTLMVGFAGAVIAARENKLLALTTTPLFGSDDLRGIGSHIAKWMSICVVLALAIGSLDLVLIERSVQYPVFVAPNVPRWVFQAVMPLALFLIGIHLIIKSKKTFLSLTGLFTLFVLIILIVSQDYLRETTLVLFLGMISFVFAIANGAPIFIVLGGIASFLFWYDYTPVSAIAAEAYRIVVSPHLATIPLFTLAGYILAESNASDRLVKVFRALFGWLPGGTPVVILLLCGFFTALTGGSGVTILALGGLLLPLMVKEGYSRNFSLGLITATGSIGLLFPPSLPLILYGVTAGISIKDIFIAGIMPGLFLILMVSIWSIWKGKVESVERHRFNWRKAFQICWETKWELLIPFLVLYGIFGGHAKLVETASLTVVYIFIIENFVYRDIVLKDNIQIISSCATLVGGVLIIIGVAMGLTSYLVDAQIPMLLLSWVKMFVSSKYLFLILLNVFLLIVGCLMDIFSAIIIIVPLIAPLGIHFGIDPIHLAIIFIANLELGFLTPPVGMNLFLSAYRFDVRMPVIYKSTFPFFLVLLLAVLFITYIPELTLGLLH